MLKLLQKNKFYVAAVLLFVLLYFYGNNMEFYQGSNKCNSSPEKVSEPTTPYLDATDDVVLERRDLVQLQREKIGRFNLDGLDNWPKNADKGWWASKVEGDIYTSPNRLIWPD